MQASASPVQDYEWVWYQGSTRVPRAEPDILSGASKLRRMRSWRTMYTLPKIPQKDPLRPFSYSRQKTRLFQSAARNSGGVPEKAIRSQRIAQNVTPTYRLVDTCAAEFEAYTPYYYSTYGSENERRESGKRKIMILGGGPTASARASNLIIAASTPPSVSLRELGFETIMVNSNPETVSTDYTPATNFILSRSRLRTCSTSTIRKSPKA